MQTIILAMLRRAVAQGLITRISDSPGNVRTVYESDYAKAMGAVGVFDADTVIIEVAEFGEYGAGYCLALCDRIRGEAPGCRLILLCPEQNELCVSTVGEAKRNGRIDDFLFYGASLDYLISKLLSI